jgi:hypothetical protein
MQYPEALAAMIPVVAEFERLGVRYYVAGSLASSIYGLARTTLDVDLVADLKSEHVAPLAAALQPAYYVSEPMIRDAIARKSCFNLIDLTYNYKVDVFVTKGRGFDQSVFQRTRRDTLGSGHPSDDFFFPSPEDAVLAKLEWYRLGDEVSDRQWRDILEVLMAQHNVLDRPYLERWAVELGVGDLLARAWKEAGI